MRSDATSQLKIREYQPGDEAFLYATWLKAYRHSSEFARRIRDVVFFERHHQAIEGILKRPRVSVLVACLDDSHDTILGYLVTERYNDRPVIHYCYVKLSFRRMGVASALLDVARVSPNESLFSHRAGEDDMVWIERRFPGLVYDPYLI